MVNQNITFTVHGDINHSIGEAYAKVKVEKLVFPNMKLTLKIFEIRMGLEKENGKPTLKKSFIYSTSPYLIHTQ